jgi:uncharacterized membrane protein
MNPYSVEPTTNHDVTPDDVINNGNGIQFHPDGRSVSSGNATAWYGKGFEHFKANPGTWIGMVIVFGVILFVLNIIPFLGGLISNLLFPVFFGGFMLACHAYDQGKPVQFDALFEGFKEKFGSLAILGLIWMLMGLVVIAIFSVFAFVFVGGALFSGALTGSAGLMGLGIGMIFLFLLLGLLLGIPMMMAIWMAPALVVFHNVAPLDALTKSFKASLKNFGAYLVFFILYFVFSILASIPLFLGWIVWAPILIAAMYCAYRDIFTS